MFISITLAVLFIIGMLVYTSVAIARIWRDQNEASEAFNAEVLEKLTKTRDNWKAANDQTEKNVRAYFAEKGIPFNENYNRV